MKSSSNSKATEERLDEIRKAARETWQAAGAIFRTSAVGGQKQESYYGLPVLKAPPWTWEVPLYLFLGGTIGVLACIAFVAQVFGSDPAMIRCALWIALIGAVVCPALLIADLGRPTRFLNMLRVFKIRSAMSLGAWILVAFSGCMVLAVLGCELISRGFANPFSILILWLGEATGAVTGLLLASYTGVLIGATAIPVWSENRIMLPAHFLIAGLGGAAATLELAGFLIPATQMLGLAASGIESLGGVFLEIRRGREHRPLHHGVSGWTMRLAGTLEGPVALLLRLYLGSTNGGRYAAAICFLVGALLTRYAWIWAGRASANDPQALFQLQRIKPGHDLFSWYRK